MRQRFDVSGKSLGEAIRFSIQIAALQVVRQIVAQREPPVMLRVWGRLERVPDNDANCLALWERCAYAR